MTANLFTNLPCPAGNGSGAATDISDLGLTKTFVVDGIGVASVVIEINNATLSTDGTWAPLIGFTTNESQTIEVAARWARVTVSGYKSGTIQVNVGATDAGATFAILNVPSVVGHGTAVDVSALPKNKTVTVGGVFSGQVVIEVSTDGTSDWNNIVAFQAPGQKSFEATADWMRVTRTSPAGGVTPVVAVGGASDVTAPGGTGSGPYALAHVTNSEGPVLAAGFNVASVNYDGTFLRVVLTTPVPDASLAIPGVTLGATSNPPDTFTVAMENASTIQIAMTDSTNTAVLLPCFVNLFLIPAP